MRKFKSFLARLGKNEEGAALIEYSVLVGLITVAVVATIVIIGDWVVSQWAALQSAVGA